MTGDTSLAFNELQLALAPLGAGDLIDRAVRLYRQHFLTLIRIAAPPVSISALPFMNLKINTENWIGRIICSTSGAQKPRELNSQPTHRNWRGDCVMRFAFIYHLFVLVLSFVLDLFQKLR